MANRGITTPAGLAGDRAGAAVQQALLSHNAGQCGYRLPGIAVTLTDLVRRGGAHDAAGVRAAPTTTCAGAVPIPASCGLRSTPWRPPVRRPTRARRPGPSRLSAVRPAAPAQDVAELEVRPPSRARRLGSLAQVPELDRWVRLTARDRVEVRIGKVELGQGILTAVAAVAADELGVDPDRIDVLSGVTGTTPSEWVTAGSGSVEQSVTAVRQACAHARRALVERAAAPPGRAAGDLVVDDGRVVTRGGGVSYWELGTGRPFGIAVAAPVEGVPAAERRWTGRGLPRVDLAAKVRGEPVFLHDLALPGMRHARVVRPPRPGARLAGRCPPRCRG